MMPLPLKYFFKSRKSRISRTSVYYLKIKANNNTWREILNKTELH